MTTLPVTTKNHNSATLRGNVTSNGAPITERGICYGKTNLDTTNCKKTTTTGAGDFSILVDNLDTAATYFFRAYAINSVGKTYSTQATFTTDWICGAKLIDTRDKKQYRTKQIGTQCWMTENLNYDMDSTSGSSCPGHNGYTPAPELCITFGRLYTWDTAKKACPTGWHLPDTTEWNLVAGENSPYGMYDLLDTNPAMWHYNQPNSTNKSGLSISGAGHYTDEDQFYGFNKVTGFYWTSSANDSVSSYDFQFWNTHSVYGKGTNSKNNKLSVRCIKD